MLQVRKLLPPSVNVFNAKPLDKGSKNDKHTRFDADDETFDALKSDQSKAAKEERKSKKSSKRSKSAKEEEEEEANNEEEDHKGKKMKSKSESNLDQALTEKKEEHKQKKRPGDKDGDAAEKKQKRATPKEELEALDDTETSFAEIFSRDNVSKGGSGDGNEKKRSSVKESGLVRVIDNKKKNKKTGSNQSKSVMAELPMGFEIGLGGESKWD